MNCGKQLSNRYIFNVYSFVRINIMKNSLQNRKLISAISIQC